MHNELNQQEILIMTNTSFSSRHWELGGESGSRHLFSKKEKFKQACWNGLAPAMLPECFQPDTALQLWEMNEADTFIDLEYGQFLAKKEKKYSVNPYVFMPEQEFN